jgi:hypothetical protein
MKGRGGFGLTWCINALLLMIVAGGRGVVQAQ